jgi:hypothetical protein
VAYFSPLGEGYVEDNRLRRGDKYWEVIEINVIEQMRKGK